MRLSLVNYRNIISFPLYLLYRRKFNSVRNNLCSEKENTNILLLVSTVFKSCGLSENHEMNSKAGALLDVNHTQHCGFTGETI
jgi:hypothetical protein